MLDNFPLISSTDQQVVKDRFFPSVSVGSDSVLLTALSHVWRIFVFLLINREANFTCLYLIKLSLYINFLSSALWLIDSLELSCRGLGMHADEGTNLYFFLASFKSI